MASLPIGKNNYARARLTDHAGNFKPVLPGIFDASVRNIERTPPASPQNLRCIRSFARAVFCSATRAHLALREIENARSLAPLGRLQQRSAAGLFDVVTVSRHGENIKRSSRHVSPDFLVQLRRSREQSGDLRPFLS